MPYGFVLGKESPLFALVMEQILLCYFNVFTKAGRILRLRYRLPYVNSLTLFDLT